MKEKYIQKKYITTIFTSQHERFPPGSLYFPSAHTLLKMLCLLYGEHVCSTKHEHKCIMVNIKHDGCIKVSCLPV